MPVGTALAAATASVGAAITGVCTLVATTAQTSGGAVFAVAQDSPASTGWYAGLAMAVGAACVSVYQGVLKANAGDRQVLLAKVLELTQEVGQLRGERVDLLARIDHIKAGVKQSSMLNAELGRHNAAEIDAVKAESRKIKAAVKQIGSSSGVGLDTGEMTPIPDPPKPKPK